jgi:kanamycin kinase/aminoglycoside 3'-phosphotransferase-3
MMACDSHFMANPKYQTQLLARALQLLWSVEIADCPCKWPLQKLLDVAEDNVINHRVDTENAQPDTFGPKGFSNPEKLLEWLKDNQPEQHSVLSHGDFCLPNILVKDDMVVGFIDLEAAGVGDIWCDYAWCIWSLEYNTGTNKYTNQLLKELNIVFDEEKFLKYTCD